MRGRQLVVAAVLLAVGLAATAEARKLALGSLSRPGPGFFPYALSLGLVVAAAGLLIQALARPAAGAATERLMHGRAALTFVITAAYVFTLEPIGFGVSTTLYLLALFRVVEPRRWIVSLVLALGTTAAALLVFKIVLAVRLPVGPWGF